LKKLIALVGAGAVALAVTLAAAAGNGSPINPGSANVLTMAVYGDAPYGTTPTDTAEFQATPAFIDSINADPKVDLVLHVGDIHSGKQYCTQAYDQAVFDLWTAYKDPLVYTPGDNEWADCHKPAEGGGLYNPITLQIDYVLDGGGNPVDYAGGDPIANLDLVRSIFFPNPGHTLGGRDKQVLSQAQSFDPGHPSDANYVENVMWEQSKVLFVTINVPGGSNNDNDVWYKAPAQSAAQSQEIAARTGADVRWLDAAFAQAQADGVEAIVIGVQADMWDLDGKTPSHLAAYEPIVSSIAGHTTAFEKPVLLFNGDSHEYRSDNPLSAADPLHYIHPAYDVPNFHRVVVHGSTFPLEWLRLTVDPRVDNPAGPNAFGPFSWERVLP
jgi:Calcineurin-like phosphoesterase